MGGFWMEHLIQLNNMEFSCIRFEMEDEHAYYYKALDPYAEGLKELEVKVVKSNGWVYWREQGKEDWWFCDTVEMEVAV
jgi:hypothetical protein